MDTRGLVFELCKKYDTRDPLEIARQRNIIVQFEPLGGVYGYYSKSLRQQFIHINQELEPQTSQFTLCHELGHSVMHPDLSTPFLRANTMYSIDKLELQANHFALEMAYRDDELQPFLNRSITDAAAYMGVSLELARYRMSSVQPTDDIWFLEC